MTTPSPAALLNLWEKGLDKPLLYKCLDLLAAAFPDKDQEVIAFWPIGRRDQFLIQLRGRLFGTHLVNTATCPECSQTVEWEMSVNDLQLNLPDETPTYQMEKPPYKVHFRLPNSIDIMRLSGQSQPLQLIRNCILEAENNGAACTTDTLPDELLFEIDRQMEQADPQSNLSFELNCPHCNHSWVSFFDILTYLWTEIDNWAKHLLQDVYVLARAFGWSEQDIIGMSARRRQFYLEMLRT